ncbi:MAG: YaaL family protein [bacterium]
MKINLNTLLDSFQAGINNLAARFLVGPPAREEEACPELLEAVAQAYREWVAAKTFFNSVTDPDLVDYAIYRIEAAQKRYVYLLRQAKQEGLRTGVWFGN